MAYGYTIANDANKDVFDNAVAFITDELHYSPYTPILQDVDGSICQCYKNNNNMLTLESDTQINYVGIISDIPLPITCLNKWTTD